MNNYANVVLMVFICFLIFSSGLFIIGYLITKKFNKRFNKIYTLLTGLGFREVFLVATTLFNLLLAIYFIYRINYFLPIGLYMIAATCFLSCFTAFNIRLIIIDIIYSGIECCLLWLLLMLNNYYNYIGTNKYILILMIIFIILIIIYALFVTIRKIYLLITMYKVGGEKNG